MIRRYQIINGALAASESEDSPVQVYVDPTQTERNALTAACDIDDHTLSSALDPDEVSRVEFTPDYIFMVWKRPKNYSGRDNFFFNVISVGLFLFKEKIVMVLPEDILLDEPGPRYAPKIHSLLDVTLTFLYRTTHHYLEHLKVIKMVSRELQQRINTSMENEHLIQMFNLSESLIYYLNAINANNVCLLKLRNYAEKAGFSAETIEFLDDIIVDNNQCYRQAEVYSTVFSGLMDARGSLVNNNMNVMLKNLTMINVVFLPLNLIASIGGMSEFSMMTQGVDWRIAYLGFFAAVVAIGLMTAVILRRLDIRRSRTRRSRKKSLLHRLKSFRIQVR